MAPSPDSTRPTAETRAPEPLPPPPGRSPLQFIASAVARAFTPAAPGELSLHSLDQRLSLHIALNDAKAFRALIGPFTAPPGPIALPEALSAACRPGKLHFLALLLQRGADPGLVLPPSGPHCANPHALHRAAAFGSTDALRLLISHGADPGAANALGQTALAIAARAQAPDSVTLLLEAGSDADHRDHQGENALSLCFPHPSFDPLIHENPDQANLEAIGRHSSELLQQAAIARALLAAGAQALHPHALFALAIRLRDPRLVALLAHQGLRPSSLLDSTDAKASRWSAYARRLSSRDPLIEDFILQARAGEASPAHHAPLAAAGSPPSAPEPSRAAQAPHPPPPAPARQLELVPIDPEPAAPGPAAPPPRRILAGPGGL